MSDGKPNGEVTLEQAMAQALDPVDINGRLAELSELNSMLTGRCAGLRGLLAQKDAALGKKDSTIAQLTEELMRYREAEKEHAAKTALHDKRKDKEAVN